MRPIVIGVAGGTGSGKTTVVRKIVDSLGDDAVSFIQHDFYYKDHPQLSLEDRGALNYDHPDALETSLLVAHLGTLRGGEAVDAPRYDFSLHARKKETQRVEPRRAIILEGILILVDQALRELMDIKIFVDTDPDVRFIRRLLRDLDERGRTLESVVDQYQKTVRPMHLKFVEPSKRYADIIIPEGGSNTVAVDMLLTKVRAIVASD
ncbi:MAG: uridine kinase [Acidobacteriota bacterium]|jgi:uridine kinase